MNDGIYSAFGRRDVPAQPTGRTPLRTVLLPIVFVCNAACLLALMLVTVAGGFWSTAKDRRNRHE